MTALYGRINTSRLVEETLKKAGKAMQSIREEKKNSYAEEQKKKITRKKKTNAIKGQRQPRARNIYSQESIAELLDINRDSIVAWEGGKRLPDTKYLIALAELYGVDCDFLLGRTNTKNKGVQYICKETGLSEAAVEKLIENKNRIMLSYDGSDEICFSDVVSDIIEHERFYYFIKRLMESKTQRTAVTENQINQQKKLENAYATLRANGYRIVAAGENNMISLYDAKAEISGIIDELFRIEAGNIELRT